MKPFYDYAWFVGFFAAGTTHLVLARPRPVGDLVTSRLSE